MSLYLASPFPPLERNHIEFRARTPDPSHKMSFVLKRVLLLLLFVHEMFDISGMFGQFYPWARAKPRNLAHMQQALASECSQAKVTKDEIRKALAEHTETMARMLKVSPSECAEVNPDTETPPAVGEATDTTLPEDGKKQDDLLDGVRAVTASHSASHFSGVPEHG